MVTEANHSHVRKTTPKLKCNLKIHSWKRRKHIQTTNFLSSMLVFVRGCTPCMEYLYNCICHEFKPNVGKCSTRVFFFKFRPKRSSLVRNLPETNSKRPKTINGWKMILPFWGKRPLFRGVWDCFREYTNDVHPVSNHSSRTCLKINMKPKNHLVAKEHHPNHPPLFFEFPRVYRLAGGRLLGGSSSQVS